VVRSVTKPLLARERHAWELVASGVSDHCEICGEPDSDVVVVEEHHVGGCEFGGMPMRGCANDHTALTLAQQQYRHVLRRPDCPWWARRLMWHLDQATLLDRQAHWHERYSHEDEERRRSTEETAKVREIAGGLREVAEAHRSLARGLLDRYGSTPAGRRLLERLPPHRRPPR
jgi:hypothetical protein